MSTDRIPTFDDLMRRGSGRVKGRVRFFFKRLFTPGGWRKSKARMKEIQWRTLGLGVVITAALVVGLGALAWWIDDLANLGPSNNWAFGLAALVAVGWLGGAFATGMLARGMHILQALIVVWFVWVVLQVLAFFLAEDVSWASVIFNGLVATAAGVIGGLIASRRLA